MKYYQKNTKLLVTAISTNHKPFEYHLEYGVTVAHPATCADIIEFFTEEASKLLKLDKKFIRIKIQEKA